MAQQDPKVQQDPRDPRDVNIKYKQLTNDVQAYSTTNDAVVAVIDGELASLSGNIAAIEALDYVEGANPLNDSAEWIALKAEIAAITAIYNTVQPQTP